MSTCKKKGLCPGRDCVCPGVQYGSAADNFTFRFSALFSTKTPLTTTIILKPHCAATILFQKPGAISRSSLIL